MRGAAAVRSARAARLIHRVRGAAETQQDIHQRVMGDLAESELPNVQLSFYLTSIYDHSIFEAFSKVVQKLIPQLDVLEKLLDILISNSGIEKAFLFDVVSKIYIATDSSPVDMQSYELCSDMIDVVIDVSCIYGMRGDAEDGIAYDSASSSVIRLNNGMVLYLREMNRCAARSGPGTASGRRRLTGPPGRPRRRFLALVCILREENFEKHGLIDYNIHCFRNGIQQVFDARRRRAGPALAAAEAR